MKMEMKININENMENKIDSTKLQSFEDSGEPKQHQVI